MSNGTNRSRSKSRGNNNGINFKHIEAARANDNVISLASLLSGANATDGALTSTAILIEVYP